MGRRRSRPFSRRSRRPGTRRADSTWARSRRSTLRTDGTSPARGRRRFRRSSRAPRELRSQFPSFVLQERRRRRDARAAAVSARRSEEAELLRAVADQHVLGLLIVIEHHLVVFAADARLLVAAERRMRRIGVVAIGPHAAGLDRAAEPVAAIGVAAPYAGAEAVERVVGDRKRFFVGLERGHRDDRTKDLLLENAHLVVALEHGR